jgi:hypothetical protein
MNQEQPPPPNPPWIEQIKYQSLEFDEKVMFLFPHGGRTVICRCLAKFEFNHDVTQKEIKEKLRKHLSNEHKEQAVDAVSTGASDAILSPQVEDDIPVIPADSLKHVKAFVSEIHPLIQSGPLISVPCPLLKVFNMDCPNGFKEADVHYCLICGDVSQSKSRGEDKKCSCKLKPVVCRGLTTFRDPNTKIRSRQGRPLVCDFPQDTSQWTGFLIGKLKLKQPSVTEDISASILPSLESVAVAPTPSVLSTPSAPSHFHSSSSSHPVPNGYSSHPLHNPWTSTWSSSYAVPHTSRTPSDPIPIHWNPTSPNLEWNSSSSSSSEPPLWSPTSSIRGPHMLLGQRKAPFDFNFERSGIVEEGQRYSNRIENSNAIHTKSDDVRRELNLSEISQSELTEMYQLVKRPIKEGFETFVLEHVTSGVSKTCNRALSKLAPKSQSDLYSWSGGGTGMVRSVANSTARKYKSLVLDKITLACLRSKHPKVAKFQTTLRKDFDEYLANSDPLAQHAIWERMVENLFKELHELFFDASENGYMFSTIVPCCFLTTSEPQTASAPLAAPLEDDYDSEDDDRFEREGDEYGGDTQSGMKYVHVMTAADAGRVASAIRHVFNSMIAVVYQGNEPKGISRVRLFGRLNSRKTDCLAPHVGLKVG